LSSRNFSGVTSDYCRGAISGITYPLTIIEWVRYTTIGSTGTTRWIICDGSSSSNFIAGRNEDDGSPRLTRNAGSDTHTNVDATMTAGQWHFIATRLAAIDDAEVILDADFGGKASSATSVNPSGIDRLSFGKRDNSSNSNPASFQCAQWAAWNADLSDAEITALKAGAHPLEIQPEKLIHLYDNWGRTTGFVRDEVGGVDLAINGTNASDQSPAGLSHYQDIAGTIGAAASVPTAKFLELRVSIADAWESVQIPVTRDLAEYYFELTDAGLVIGETGGTDATATPSDTLNAQTGNMTWGACPALVSDLLQLEAANQREDYEAILAARLAPIPLDPELTLASGTAAVIDLTLYVRAFGLSLSFGPPSFALPTTVASISGTELTVSSSVEASDTITVSITNGHPEYPATATLRLALTFAATATEFANGYGYRKEFIAPGRSGTTETVTDFVLLVSITDSELATVANSGRLQSSSGWDLLFTDASDSPLDFEIQSYTAATGALIAWVRLPSWALSSQYRFRLYYGKAGLTVTPSDPSATWAGELRVWDALTGADLTGNGSTLTISGVTTGTLIGEAGSYDGTDIASRSNLSIWGGLTGLTVRTLIDIGEASLGTDDGIFSDGPDSFEDSDYTFVLRLDANGYFGNANNAFMWSVLTAGGEQRIESAANVQQTGELYLGARYGTAQGSSLWIDRALTTPTSSSTPNGAALAAVEGVFQIGAGPKDATGEGVTATIGRVIARSAHLSAAWMGVERDSWVFRATFLGRSVETSPGDDLGPIAVPLYATVAQGESVTLNATAAAYDPQGGGLTVSAIGTPGDGGTSESAGVITYTPDESFTGDDSFTFTVSDGTNTSTATARVRVSTASDIGDSAGNSSLFARGLFSGMVTGGNRNSPLKVGGNGTDSWRNYNDDEVLMTFIADVSADLEQLWVRARAGDPARSGDRCDGGYAGNYCTEGGEYSTGDGPPVQVRIYEVSGSEGNPTLGTLVASSNVATDIVDSIFSTGREFYAFAFPPNSRLNVGQWYGAVFTPTVRSSDYVSFNMIAGPNGAGMTTALRAGPYHTNKWGCYNRRQKSGAWQVLTSDYNSSTFPQVPSCLFKWRNLARPYTGMPVVYKEGGSFFLSSSSPLRAVITPENAAPVVKLWVQAHRTNSGAGDISYTVKDHANGTSLASGTIAAASFPIDGSGTQWLWASVDLGSVQVPSSGQIRVDLSCAIGGYEFYLADAGKWVRGMQGGPFDLATLGRDWFPRQAQFFGGSGLPSLGSDIGTRIALEHEGQVSTDPPPPPTSGLQQLPTPLSSASADASDVVSVASAAPAGRRISLAAGNYDGLTINVPSGTEANPVQFVPSNPDNPPNLRRCIITGNGHAIFAGIVSDDRALSSSSETRSLRISGSNKSMWYCEFGGNRIAVAIEQNNPANLHLYRCDWLGQTDSGASNGDEAIKAGDQSDIARDMGLLVEECRISNFVTGSETISVKSAGCTFRKVHIRNSRNIHTRHGNEATFDQINMPDSDMVIFCQGHTITNIIAREIRLCQGTEPASNTANGTGGSYNACASTTVQNLTGSLKVNTQPFGGPSWDNNASNCKWSGVSGSVSVTSGGTGNSATAPTIAAVTPPTYGDSDVGVTAYKASI
jgi:hypothetical protein